MGKKIGKGAFGDVFEANYLRENQKVAVKTCRSSDVYDMEKFLQEADILKGYQHPNIVRSAQYMYDYSHFCVSCHHV